jgi:hypothetical protein
MAQATAPAASRGTSIAIAAIVAIGFALTIGTFYPGYLTVDARFVYEAITKGLGDWQSPVMSVLWQWIDPIAPGPMSMFLLQAVLYWSGFGLLALALSRRAPWLGIVAALLAFMPPAFVFVGFIWRDVLFATVWLWAAAVTYATVHCSRTVRWPAQALALALIALGVLLRPNAIVAAPILASYVVWPSAFRSRRAILLLIPGVIAGYALIHLVYYGVLNADRQNPLHSILVFDLGGITYFSGQNQFPVPFAPEETALLFTSKCYDPVRWDNYWTFPPCDFVMKRLERTDDKIFGRPRLMEAWWRAVTSHPADYLRHRLNFMRRLVAESNLVLPVLELDRPERQVHVRNPAFMTLVGLHGALQPTWLFRLGPWLALAIAVCLFGWRVRATPSGAFAVAVTSSAVVYVLAFFPLGVAADFRYGYWCVLAALAGVAALAAARRDAVSAVASPPA